MNAQNRTVVIADDHPIFRMGLSSLLSSITGFEKVAEADNGEDAIEQIKKHNPNYVIVDIDMPKATGIEVANFIINNALSAKIIILTAHTDPVTIEQALNLPNVSVLFKESASRELRICLESMEEGKIFISPICMKFSENRALENKCINKTIETIKSLTATEQKILYLVSKHRTTNQIAEMLNNSYKTIENHRTNISQKLHLTGPNSLLRFAMENEKLIKQIVGQQ